MTINIKATNTELTPAISSYVEDKIGALNKFIAEEDPKNVLMNVEIGLNTKHHKQGKIFRAEVNINFGDKFVRAVSEQEDLYAAIDNMRDIAIREINDYKDKERTMLRKGGSLVKRFLRGFRRR